MAPVIAADYRMIPLLLALLAGPPKPITLTVAPWISVAPATVIVQAHLVPIASDRLVRIEIESDDFFTSTECQLEGENSPKLCPVQKPLLLARLGPGIYAIRAGIGPWAGFRAVIGQRVEVQ